MPTRRRIQRLSSPYGQEHMAMSTLDEVLSEIRQNLKNSAYPNEQTIVSRVILRLLHVLGWDTNNPGAVYEQYPAIPGERKKKIDLALFMPGNTVPDIYIEVKKHGLLQNQEEERRAEDQLWEYDKHNRVKMGILTDGQVWHFYNPFATGTYADRRGYTLDLLARTPDACARYLELLMSASAVGTGKAIDELKRLHKERAPEAATRADFGDVWSKLLREPNEYFLEGIVTAFQQYKGTSPKVEILSRLLREIQDHSSPFDQIVDDAEIPSAEIPSNKKLREAPSASSRKRPKTKIRVKMTWQADKEDMAPEVMCEDSAADTLLRFVERLADVYGKEVLGKLESLSVNRGPLVTRKPNPKYSHKRVHGSDYFVLTHSSTSEKVDILQKVMSHLRLSPSLLQIEVI